MQLQIKADNFVYLYMCLIIFVVNSIKYVQDAKLYLNNVKNNIILAKSLVETGGNKIVDYW